MKNVHGKEAGGRMRYKVLMVVAAVCIVAVSGIFLVLRMNKPKERTFASGQQSTVELAKMDLTNSVSATGTVESMKTKLVSAQVSDVQIKSVKVSEGDEVKKGQTLLTLDKTDLQRALSEAEENLSDVKEQASGEVSSAKRKLSEAESNYQSQKTRLAKSVAEAKKNEQEKSAYEQAVAEQQNTNKQNKSEIQSAKDAVTTAENNRKKSVREAEQKVEDARKALERCEVTAPVSGTVTAVGAEAGDTYAGGDLFEISDCANLQVSTTVGEYDISNVKAGQKVAILTDATGEDELEGEITYVAVSAGSSSLSTGSNSGNAGSSASSGMSSSASSGSDSGYTVKIKIAAVDERLRIGMTAKCSIILQEAADVYAVPYDAVHKNAEGKQVIYVEDGVGKKEVEVEKGMESDYYVEISGGDLQDGMKVIIPSDSAEAGSSDDSGGTDIPDMGNMPQGDGSGRDGGRGNGAPPGGFGGGGFSGGGPGM